MMDRAVARILEIRPSHTIRLHILLQYSTSRGIGRSQEIRGRIMGSKSPVAAIFQNLKGNWHLKRALNSVLPGFPSGVFEGTASFTPRKPGELLYAEHGELKTESGFTLKANRKYIYKYNADEDKISAWFVQEETKQNEGKEEIDYLFYDLEMEQLKEGWIGKGDHLCNMDMYWAYYDFRPAKAAMEGAMDVFGIRYKVKGPDKDYTSDTAYQRTFNNDSIVS